MISIPLLSSSNTERVGGINAVGVTFNEPFIINVSIISSQINCDILVLDCRCFIEYITLLQPAYSTTRYLIAYGKKKRTEALAGFRLEVLRTLKSIKGFRALTSIINDVRTPIPQPFITWALRYQ